MAVEIYKEGEKWVRRKMAVGEMVECVWYENKPGSELIPGRVEITEEGVRAIDEAAEENPTLENKSFQLRPGQSVRIAFADHRPTKTYAIRVPLKTSSPVAETTCPTKASVPN